MVRLRDGLDHASVGDADLRDGADAGRRGEQAPPPRPHHRLQVGVARDHDQDARTHVALVSAMWEDWTYINRCRDIDYLGLIHIV